MGDTLFMFQIMLSYGHSFWDTLIDDVAVHFLKCIVKSYLGGQSLRSIFADSADDETRVSSDIG